MLARIAASASSRSANGPSVRSSAVVDAHGEHTQLGPPGRADERRAGAHDAHEVVDRDDRRAPEPGEPDEVLRAGVLEDVLGVGGVAARHVGGHQRAGRGAVDRVEPRRQSEPLERERHPAGHRDREPPALDPQGQAQAVVARAGARHGGRAPRGARAARSGSRSGGAAECIGGQYRRATIRRADERAVQQPPRPVAGRASPSPPARRRGRARARRPPARRRRRLQRGQRRNLGSDRPARRREGRAAAAAPRGAGPPRRARPEPAEARADARERRDRAHAEDDARTSGSPARRPAASR